MQQSNVKELNVNDGTYRVGNHVVVVDWNYTLWCQENRVVRIDDIEVDQSHFYEYENGNKEAPIRICIPEIIVRHATVDEIRSEIEKRERELLVNAFKSAI
ncbi:hypothetical protein [Bacillus toyonensis]|uniref:hypothetical protein n=1 Tax=Bacillus toyonensis TaxID=155322 RepID=UPI002E1A66F3|nr:hypothetical protein [Bacillus toyonensis]